MVGLDKEPSSLELERPLIAEQAERLPERMEFQLNWDFHSNFIAV